MNAERYVNAIVRKIKCGGKRKREIKRQLLADINMQLEQGNPLEQVIRQMGAVKEVADSFNENISKEEQRRYTRNKWIKIIVPVVLVFSVFAYGIYWFFPKTSEIHQSQYFEAEKVEMTMKKTVELLDAGDYEALRADAIPEMQSVLAEEKMEEVKKQVAMQWGERLQFGTVYLTELTQGGVHFATGEITVTYEKISVTYRLTYNTKLELAGLYMR